MKIVGYVRGNDSRTNDRVKHLTEALGGSYSTREVPVECDLAIQAGFQISPAMLHAMSKGTPIIILENPVWGKEDGVYTWAYNGLNLGGWVPPCGGLARRSKPQLKPWKEWDSGDITVFGQVDGDKALRGHDIGLWAEQCYNLLPSSVYRAHPIMLNRSVSQESYWDCLDRTSLAITFNSTCGSQAVIEGIPTVACHWGSLAWDVATHELSEAPITPNRDEWLHALSYRHIDENIPIEYILSGYEEAESRAARGEYDNMSNGRDQ